MADSRLPGQRSASAASRPKRNTIEPIPLTAQNGSRPIPSRAPRPQQDDPVARKTKKERLRNNLSAMDWKPETNGQADVQDSGAEISILGRAGPYTVVASNFAPGTTAADIESAMLPVGGEMLGCEIIARNPTTIAEMVFSERAKADNIIATFNNKRADGRLLHLHLKPGTPSARLKNQARAQSLNEPPRNAPSEPKAARIDLTNEENSYDRQREQFDRNRRRAEPEIQDGSYGFEAKADRMEVDGNENREPSRDHPRPVGRGRAGDHFREERRLYSDDYYSRPRGPRGRGYR
ncbi:MAG: hypothetical protein Q9174_004928 [Haloplaca sp. 1 TL-2023]